MGTYAAVRIEPRQPRRRRATGDTFLEIVDVLIFTLELEHDRVGRERRPVFVYFSVDRRTSPAVRRERETKKGRHGEWERRWDAYGKK